MKKIIEKLKNPVNTNSFKIGMPKKLFGFTLAEVLITLGIIGVVAAMTIPNLMYKMQTDQLHTKFKKAYSDLNQIAMRFMTENDGVSVSLWVRSHSWDEFVNELNKYSKSNQKYEDYKWGQDNEKAKQYWKYSFHGRKFRNFPSCDNSPFYMDMAGRLYQFDDRPPEGLNGPRMCMDLNGKNPPNVYGIDIFSFIWTVDGRVVPEGEPHPSNFIEERGIHWGGTLLYDARSCMSSNSGNPGATCAYFALHDINPKGAGTYWKDFIGKQLYK